MEHRGVQRRTGEPAGSFVFFRVKKEKIGGREVSRNGNPGFIDPGDN